ncbi:hypothetical protein ACFS7Z_08755 [Pontibacter toksunensis]|uniref:Uncharacterized protein n=1 Tax=Pontibacter toksunensis TaxID=1332631 RepID=A0ABW6BT60_9BACT
MCQSLDFISAAEKWTEGESLSDYCLYGLSFVWIGRIGQIIQFLGGFTIVAEIIGREKILVYRDNIESLINIREFIRKTRNDIKLLKIYVNLNFFINNIPFALYIREKAKERYQVNFFYRDLIRFRKEYEEWRQAHSIEYEKWQEKRNLIRPHKKRFSRFVFNVGLPFTFIFLCFCIYMLFCIYGITFKTLTIFVILFVPLLLSGLYSSIVVGLFLMLLILMLPILYIPFLLLRVIIAFFIEIFVFKLALCYLNFAQKESIFKLTGFFLISIGFLIALFSD